MSFGAPHLHLRVTDSTNDRARKLAEDGAPSGTVVTASEQTAGRGRRGRVWTAPAGKALLYSAILSPLELEHVLLPLSVPVAVCEAIEAAGAGPTQIKWPNDVWLDQAKVAGVLIEARPPEWAVIGIGVNVAIEREEFPADLRWPATSVGGGASVAELHERLSATLGEWVAAPETAHPGELSRPRRPARARGSAGRAPGSSRARGSPMGSTIAATWWSRPTASESRSARARSPCASPSARRAYPQRR